MPAPGKIALTALGDNGYNRAGVIAIMAQVTCLGILVADIVGRPVDRMPDRGTLIGIDRIELHTGGCAANTGVSLSKLGVKTNIVGKVGHDSLGDFMISSIERQGANMAGVVRDPHSPTSATMVMVDSGGERSFIHSTGTNATFSESDIRWEVIEAAPILHVAGPFLMTDFVGDQCANVLRRAQELGKVTTLDTVWDFTGRWMDVLKPSLPYLDYALPSIDEAKAITGKSDVRDIAQVFLDNGVRNVGIKLGAEGSYFRTAAGDEVRVGSLPVDAIDSLGAGDAWAAGFLTGLVYKWDAERCLRFANAVGASCVQALGATTGVQSFDETCRLAFGDVEAEAILSS
jgi:sugar/nucleoside kinase (ribokinase family)